MMPITKINSLDISLVLKAVRDPTTLIHLLVGLATFPSRITSTYRGLLLIYVARFYPPLVARRVAELTYIWNSPVVISLNTDPDQH